MTSAKATQVRTVKGRTAKALHAAVASEAQRLTQSHEADTVLVVYGKDAANVFWEQPRASAPTAPVPPSSRAVR